MNLAQALHQARLALAGKSFDEASLEAEVLLKKATGLDRTHLYSQLREELSPAQSQALDGLLERRFHHEPIPYILGHREFFALDFLVDRRVLIPRPETELLVEEALAWARHRGSPCLMADVGTGCGAIAVSLAVHLPQSTIYATDVSSETLEVAAINVRRHGVAGRVRLLPGDLLQPLPQAVDLIVANLPYVKRADWEALSPEIRDFEPAVALLGGTEGLEHVARLLQQAPSRLLPGGLLLAELGQGQGQPLIDQARALFPRAELSLLRDSAGLERALRVELPQALPEKGHA